jgi:hypothetical protein
LHAPNHTDTSSFIPLNIIIYQIPGTIINKKCPRDMVAGGLLYNGIYTNVSEAIAVLLRDL